MENKKNPKGAGRKRINPASLQKPFTIQVDDETRNKLAFYAGALNLSRSGVINLALKDFFKKYKNEVEQKILKIVE